jgi:hypothetical protein
MESPVRRTECPREQEVLDVVASRRWPERVEIDLRRHVATCSICADLLEVAAIFAEDHELASAEARVPPPAVVWWKAQMRARQEAARTAARPIAVALCMAGLASIALAATLGAAVWQWLPDIPAAPDLTPLAAAARTHAPLLLLVLLPWLVLAPIAAWLAFARD